ncbi:hypothetical protein O181_028457 [Austropuccinia psidii MF-1]|uniref:Uncharacterized protein n=1 Tax=Austropuccinia psidii MF-1 TaxID=1389203 RepID=A0A9Q3H2L5_9BASI|nr:hypothetical protein [Austropuccinia psidii MF-1]
MGNVIRENSDDNQNPIKQFLVDYQEETQLEIQEINLEAGLPQETSNRSLFKHTQVAPKFPVAPTKEMEYIHGTATKMIVCVENDQHPLIIVSGEHCSVVAQD